MFKSLSKNVLFRDTFWIAFARGLTVLMGMVTSIVLTRCLSVSEIGTYELMFTYIAIGKVTTLPGMSHIITKGVIKGYDLIYSRTVKLSFYFSVIGAVVFVFGGVYSLLAGRDNAMAPLMVIAGIIFPVFSLGQWDSVLAGKRKFRQSRILCISTGLASLAIISITAIMSRNLVCVFTAACLTQALTGVVGYIIARKQIGVCRVDRVLEGELLKQGWKITFLSVFGFVVGRIDRLIIGTCDPAILAVYYIGSRIPEMIKSVTKELLMVPVTHFSTMNKKDNIKAIIKFGWVLLLGGVMITLVIWVLSPWLIVFLYGIQYKGAILVTRLLALTIGGVLLKYVISTMDLMQGKGKYYRQITIISQILYLPVVYILFKKYSMIGVVISTLFTETVAFLGFLCYFIGSYRKTMKG